MYRHDMVWRLVFRVTAVAAALMIAPFLANPTTQHALTRCLIFLPILAVAVILAGCYALKPELRLFNNVSDTYRCEQNNALFDVPGWSPNQPDSHDFDKRVWAFMAVLLVGAVVYFVIFEFIWLNHLIQSWK
jgi:hypothetical protein